MSLDIFNREQVAADSWSVGYMLELLEQIADGRVEGKLIVPLAKKAVEAVKSCQAKADEAAKK